MLPMALTAALIVGDDVALRSSPERDAARQATLWRGDWLEVRGERKGWVKVYDHRHERPGWIDEDYVRTYQVEEATAPALRGVIDFLRDTPGSESLGIGYTGLYMRAAPPSALDSGLFSALGELAERLAVRASTGGAGRSAGALAAQLEVAESWGIHFTSIETEDGTRICYDGDAFRYVMTLDDDPDDVARAALALSDGDCVAPTLGMTERRAIDEKRLALVEKLDPTRVKGWLGNRLRIRRAQIAASLAWTYARSGDGAAAKAASKAAVEALLRVDKTELADEDAGAYEEAALLVAASHWGAEVAPVAAAKKSAPALVVTVGEEGETCVTLAAGDKPPPETPLECTHGHIWTASFRVSPDGASATVAVGPLAGWLELWLFRRGADGGWMVDVLPPTTDGVDLGYVDLAGWSPDGKQALVVREAREEGRVRRVFQVVALGTLEIERETRLFSSLGKVKKWATSDWRSRTLALR